MMWKIKRLQEVRRIWTTATKAWASARESVFKLMREPTEGTQMELEQALQEMEEISKILSLLAANIGKSGKRKYCSPPRHAFGRPFSSTDTDEKTAQSLKPLICKRYPPKYSFSALIYARNSRLSGNQL
ncbi:hypothetical protein RB195_018577 [Necator americanus]|uniref:Uncharacterized protein n=1 Tax=Necator americanus TaxID=51031 RepID=A0ABR1CBS1_NECAM